MDQACSMTFTTLPRPSPTVDGHLVYQPLTVLPKVPPERRRVVVSWAQHLSEVRAAQRLRYQVFAEEMGARLSTTVPGHDVDLFDNYCEHLLVRDEFTQQVIGTYRVLTPVQAQRVGSTYSDTEFDLTRLRGLRDRMVELGRSCVHKDYRQGAVIMLLWGALGEFMTRNKLDTMIGCARFRLPTWPPLSTRCARVCLCQWNDWIRHWMWSPRR